MFEELDKINLDGEAGGNTQIPTGEGDDATDASLEQEAEEQEAEGQEPIPETEIKTITELAENLEIDPAQFYNLVVPMAEGIEPLTLSQLKDHYQNAIRGRSDIDQERTKIQKELTATQKQILDMKGFVDKIPEEIQQVDQQVNQIIAAYNDIDWQKFESEQPAQAVLEKQRFNEAYATALNKKKEVEGKITQAQEFAFNQYLMGQRDKVVKLIPEWQNNKPLYETDLKNMISLMGEYAFTQSEISNIHDARLIKMVRDYTILKNKIQSARDTEKQKHSDIKTVTAGGLKLQVGKDKRSEVAKIIQAGKSTKNNRAKADYITKLLEQSEG